MLANTRVRLATVAFLLSGLSSCAATKSGPETLTVDQSTCRLLAERSDLADIVQLELVGNVPPEVLHNVAERFISLRTLTFRGHDGLTSAHLSALRHMPIAALQLVDARIADPRLLSVLAGHEQLARVALCRVLGLRGEVLDDAMRLPNMTELDLRELPGLVRSGSDVYLDVWTNLLLQHLAEPGVTPVAHCQLRLTGANGTPWHELVRLARVRSARLDLTGKIDASLIPLRASGSSFTPEAQRLADAHAIVHLASQLQQRFAMIEE